MIPYILYAALLLSVCVLLLQKETHYRLNRLILLVCLGLSFSLPLLPIPAQWSLNSGNAAYIPPPEQTVELHPALSPTQPATPDNSRETVQAPEPPRWQRTVKWAFYLYWLGVAAFGLNFLLQIAVLLYQAYTKPRMRDGRFRIIELDNDKAPCSFGRYIFINPSKYEWDTYNQILLHEKVHIREWHSTDILLAELMLVFQWFNPFAWLYRKELENNLEFLTDDVVLRGHEVERESYQLSLLKVSASHLPLSVTTNYNQSLLKKRIIMMNATRSNIHTMWKYFILIPVLGLLVCVFNRPASTMAQSSAVTKTSAPQDHFSEKGSASDKSEGYWFATIKGEQVHIEFKGDDENENWSSSATFRLSELPALPRDSKGEFSIKREAGVMLLNGRFDGNQGYGHYKFTPDEAYKAHMLKEGIAKIEEQDLFAFFMVNVTKTYVTMLKANGFTDLTRNEIIPLAALKIDEPYIRFWKENGFKPTTHDLIAAKSLNIDKGYVSDIRQAGYRDLSINQLISFKSQGIDGKYINGLRKANIKDVGNDGENNLPSPNNIAAFKSLRIDSAYISSLAAVGYTDVSYNSLTAMKSLNITPEYIKGLADAGYRNIPANTLLSFKSQDITPAFIKRFEAAGYKNIPLNDLVTLKSLDITPAYIKSFEDVGYSNIRLHDLVPMKSLDITPAYIKGFKELGFTNISLLDLPALKSTGVTPEYVAEMRKKGFNSTDIKKYIQLKTAFN
jgi:hypothetical protein